MSAIEIHGCDLRKMEFTSVNDGEPIVGINVCDDSNTGKALLETDSSGKVLFCCNRDCNWNNYMFRRIKSNNAETLTKEMVSDFT